MSTPEKHPSNSEEKLAKGAALEYHGEFFTGPLHSDAQAELERQHPNHDGSAVSGFLTADGKFIPERDKAFQVADKAGQVREGESGSRRTGKLRSEDLK